MAPSLPEGGTHLDYDVVFGTSVSKWLVLAALLALLWVARGVLPPFIIAGILAYVLSPLVDELAERSGVRRVWVALGVFGLVVLVVAGLVMLAGARLGNEVRDLAREGPSIVESVVDKLTGGQTIDLLGQSITSREARKLAETHFDARQVMVKILTCALD